MIQNEESIYWLTKHFIKKISKYINDYYYLKVSPLLHTSCEISSEDLLVASYPRSGRTWVRLFMCFYLKHTYNIDIKITWNNFDKLAPSPLCKPNSRGGLRGYPWELPRPIFSHRRAFANYFEGNRVVYLTRNFDDILVSRYYYAKHHGAKRISNMSIEKFIVQEFKWRREIATINRFSEELEKCDERLIVRYEDLKRNKKKTFKQIIDFSPYEYVSSNVSKSIEKSSFENIRKKEEKERERNNSQAFHARSGGSGGAKKELSDTMLYFVNNIAEERLSGVLSRFYVR